MQSVVETDILKDAVSVATQIVDEAKLRFTGDGVSLRAVDAADAAMVELEISREVFESLAVQDAVEVAVDLEKLEEYVKTLPSGELVTVKVDAREMRLECSPFNYEMRLPDVSSVRKEPTIPDIELTCRAVLPGAEFKNAVKACGLVSDAIRFTADSDGFCIEAKGDSDDLQITKTPSDLVEFAVEEAPNSLFSKDYLIDMSKGCGGAEAVAIRVGTDLPMKLNFEMHGGIDATYVLAPRIES